MIITPQQLEAASGKFQARFLLTCLSAGFEPSVVYAAGTQSQLMNFYRAMGRNGNHCLGCSTTAEGALDLISRVKPSILSVVDDLPDMSLIGLAQHAKKIHPQIRVIAFISNLDDVLTMKAIPVLVADQDLVAHPEVITVAAMAVISNTIYRSPSLASSMSAASHRPVDQEVGPFDLSLRERQLLEAYALGLSNKETAEQLGLSVRTVQTYSANLLQKLGVNNRQKALRRVISLGFRAVVRRIEVP
jgi:two-component system, NarL family, nitrate/nitrite response regulator NarL